MIIKIYLTVVTLLSLFATPCKPATPNSLTNEYELAYNEWHAAIAQIEGVYPLYFRDNGPAGDAVKKIKAYGLRMAEFICEKVANEADEITEHVYADLKLLDAITGINLIYSDQIFMNYRDFRPNIRLLKARFREEWRAGVYEHPDQKVAELLEPLLKQEPVSTIIPQQLANVRRYGIYGVPELIRQVKKNNSSTAFCVYLIVTGHREAYADYLKHPDKMYVTKEEKLRHIEKKLKEWKNNGDDKHPVVIKIDAALKE